MEKCPLRPKDDSVQPDHFNVRRLRMRRGYWLVDRPQLSPDNGIGPAMEKRPPDALGFLRDRPKDDSIQPDHFNIRRLDALRLF